MQIPLTDAASRNSWTLIRRVRQLVTLQGPSGPHRGAAMRELHVVNDAALLVHDGVVRDAGTARRIENLAEARHAVEVDAGGRLVMPAFVEPDATLITAGGESLSENGPDPAIATASKKVLESHGRMAIEDWVRHGVLAVGSATRGATNLRDARKILGVQKLLQTRPIRIRSVFAPDAAEVAAAGNKNVVEQWAGVIVEKRLAGLLELELAEDGSAFGPDQMEELIQRALPYGFILRLSSDRLLSARAQRLVCGAGAISVMAPGIEGEPIPEFTRASCILIIRTRDILAGRHGQTCARKLVDEGWAVALGSGARNRAALILNTCSTLPAHSWA